MTSTAKYYTKLFTDRYIISHGLLRHILSYYTKQSPQNIQLTTNKYGKPFLNDSNIKFNMSHSHNIVSIAVTFDNNVGIDIEFNNNNLEIIELSELVLTPKEIITFNTLYPREQMDTFYNLWTKKEALIKAIGEGFSYPITTIEALSIVQGDNVILTSIENSIKYELYTYILQVIRNFSGAIATEKKINEIIYIEAHHNNSIFDNISSICPYY